MNARRRECLSCWRNGTAELGATINDMRDERSSRGRVGALWRYLEASDGLDAGRFGESSNRKKPC